MTTARSLTQVKLWLLENEDYHREIQPIINQHCPFCLDGRRDQPCIGWIYEDEFAFNQLFIRTGVLPKYLDTAPDIDALIEFYNNTNLSNEMELRNWLIYLEDFWAER